MLKKGAELPNASILCQPFDKLGDFESTDEYLTRIIKSQIDQYFTIEMTRSIFYGFSVDEVLAVCSEKQISAN